MRSKLLLLACVAGLCWAGSAPADEATKLSKFDAIDWRGMELVNDAVDLAEMGLDPDRTPEERERCFARLRNVIGHIESMVPDDKLKGPERRPGAAYPYLPEKPAAPVDETACEGDCTGPTVSEMRADMAEDGVPENYIDAMTTEQVRDIYRRAQAVTAPRSAVRKSVLKPKPADPE